MLTSTPPKAEYVNALVEEFLAVLNEKEVQRRIEVNAKHRAEFGRDLYPEGGQYAYFTAVPGRTYTKVVQTLAGRDGGTSVHCFVDKHGRVLKAAGWSRPASGVRYDLTDPTSRDACFARCEFSGGYLYR